MSLVGISAPTGHVKGCPKRNAIHGRGGPQRNAITVGLNASSSNCISAKVWRPPHMAGTTNSIPPSNVVARVALGVLPTAKVQGSEVAQLTRLLQLNKAHGLEDQSQLERMIQDAGLTLVANSTSATGGSFASMTDTFDEYEDMQGVPISELRNSAMNAGMTGSIDEADIAGPNQSNSFAGGASALHQLSAKRQYSFMGDDDKGGAWDERVPVDASVDGHEEDADNYGDGGAASRPGDIGVATPSQAITDVASKYLMNTVNPVTTAAGSAAKATSRVAANAYAQVSSLISGNKAAAPTTMPQKTHWVVVDDMANSTRIIMLSPSANAKQGVQSRTNNLVPFEGQKTAKISSVLQLETRDLFMRLLPPIMEALDRGMNVSLTGEGAGGSLAGILALMCARQGLGSGTTNLGAIAFNAVPCIAEEAHHVGSSTQDEQEAVDSIMTHGLLVSMGLPATMIRSVAVAGAGSDSLVSTLSSLLPNRGKGSAEQQTSVSVQKTKDGKVVTVFRPLGTLLTLDV